MARPQKPGKVNFFSSFIFSERKYFEEAMKLLKDLYGEIDLMSEEFPFSETEYYRDEMGDNLKRVFVSFKELQFPDFLPSAKLKCVEIEDMLSFPPGKRKVNIDPGYIDLHKIVFSSCKYGSGKIYLSDGVYADIVLIYRNKNFHSLPWTFPDFRSGKYNSFFFELRKIYKEKLREDRKNISDQLFEENE